MEIEDSIRALFLGKDQFLECNILENVAHLHETKGNSVILTLHKAKKCLDQLLEEYEEDDSNYPNENQMLTILWNKLYEVQKECLFNR